jgi:tetratricopeptide (TPR) repeat protein
MAFIVSCRTFAEEPADAAVAAAVQRLAEETEAWDELAAVYEQVAEDAKGLQKARLLLDLGRIRDRRADDADGAEAAFRRALEVDPASPEALDALTDLFTRRGRVRDLVIVLEQKLEAAAGLEEKKATLREMARLYDAQLKDPDEAIEALKRVLELDGADAPALELLAGLYRRQARWGDLAGILARARDLTTEDDRRVAYQLQIAALHEGELADDESAVEAYRAVLGLDDRNTEALAGLERLYTKLDRFAELNRVYEREAELAADPRERVRILGKSASIWEEKLNNNHLAIERNEAVLAIDGSNLSALKSLERLYRGEAHWEKLIEVLERHAALTQDRRERVALQVQVGDVWQKDLGRLDRAEEVYGQALQVDPDSREVISALARLHERSGNWNLALEMLQREARVAGDAVEIQSRIGRIHEEMLGDREAAKAAYARALDADPGHLPSLRALRGIAEAERDRDAYLKLLLAESRYAEDEATKANLLEEAGRIHQEEKDDPDAAVRLYEEALKRVADHLPAARPLADLYVARANWQRAEAVLDVIVRRLAQDGDAKELCRQSYRLGYVAEKLGNREKALACYRRAYELDATYLPALEGLGHLLVQGGSWDEALRIFQAILIHHRDGLTDLEVVETYWQIGEIQGKLGQGERAAKSYEKALEIDAGHEPSRRALVGVLEAAGSYESAVEHRQTLLGALEGEEKVRMFLELGAICRDRLHDPYQAIDAFLGAARTDPGNVEAAEALLGLYRDTRQQQKAADALARMLQQPAIRKDPQRAARLHHALATALREDLHDDDGAVRELDAALDADPKLVQAFADQEALLTARKRWRDLEGAYVRMIQRLPKGPEGAAARIALWKTLGELYRRVLNDVEGARTAFEVAAKADPGDVVALEAYAELAAKCRGREPEAVEAYRRLLRIGNAPQPAVSALIGLHAEMKRYDEAYAAAQTLAFLLGGGRTEEGQVVSRLRRFARDTASAQLDDALWAERLLHERARGPLVAILSLLVREASEVFIQSPKDLGLNPKKDELDVAASMLFFANMYKYVARTLGFTVPRLFRSAEAGSRLQLLPLQPWALLASEDLFKERPKKELWFTIGKSMAFLRPELTPARLMPHDQLNAVFQAAASLGTSRYVVTADPQLIDKLKRRLERVLPEQTRTQKLKLLARAYCDVQQPGDVRAYMDAAELTSNRVGALLAGDLDVVRKMVVTERAAVSKLKEEARLRDLVLFCTSEDHAALREHLGLSVIVPT